MMKRTLLFSTTALLLLSAGQAWAQDRPYDDLLVRYVDEKYEDCLFKAERYTMREQTKRDPLPYLYMSMCYFEMSKIPKYQEMDEYKKADRDAMKWAEKYRKKDKDMEFFHNYEDYWASLNTMVQENGLNAYEGEAKELSKARRYFQSMTRYYPENPGGWLMLALSQYRSNMARDGDESMKGYEAALAEVGSLDNLPPDQKMLMKSALIHLAEYLDDKGDRNGARQAMELGKDVFMDDPEFKGAYNSFQ